MGTHKKLMLPSFLSPGSATLKQKLRTICEQTKRLAPTRNFRTLFAVMFQSAPQISISTEENDALRTCFTLAERFLSVVAKTVSLTDSCRNIIRLAHAFLIILIPMKLSSQRVSLWKIEIGNLTSENMNMLVGTLSGKDASLTDVDEQIVWQILAV